MPHRQSVAFDRKTELCDWGCTALYHLIAQQITNCNAYGIGRIGSCVQGAGRIRGCEIRGDDR